MDCAFTTICTIDLIVLSQQSLSFQVLVRLLVDNIPLTVLVLFLVVWLPGLVKLLHLQLLPESHCVFYLRHICKVSSVRNTQASHPMSMTPLCKMMLKCLGALENSKMLDIKNLKKYMTLYV